MGHSIDKGRLATCRIAPRGRFHFDGACSLVGQQLGAESAGQTMGQFHHFYVR